MAIKPLKKPCLNEDRLPKIFLPLDVGYGERHDCEYYNVIQRKDKPNTEALKG
jgi:hypothetical protein